MTGNRGGAPVGNRNGLRHGRRSARAVAERKAATRVLRQIGGLVEEAARMVAGAGWDLARRAQDARPAPPGQP